MHLFVSLIIAILLGGFLTLYHDNSHIRFLLEILPRNINVIVKGPNKLRDRFVLSQLSVKRQITLAAGTKVEIHIFANLTLL